MLNFQLINEDNITVTVYPPGENEVTENELDVRELGDIIKTSLNEYEFHTTPQKYLHALSWIEDGDLEKLKEKLNDLNSG